MNNSFPVITDSEEEELLKLDSDEDKYSDVVSEDDRLLDKTPDPNIDQNSVFDKMPQDNNEPSGSLLRTNTGKDKQNMDETISQIVIFDEMAEDINQSRGSSIRTKKRTNATIIDNIFSGIAGCINVLLIGKTGSGKSTIGNIISGGVPFKVSLNAQLVTTECQEAKVHINNVPVNIVDTPGLFNLKIDNNSVQAMIGEYLKTHMHLFPLIFVLCIQDGVRFTKEDESVLNRIKGMFGTHMLQNLIVVFTGTMPTVDMPEVLKQFLKEIDNITFHFPTDSGSPERDIKRAVFLKTCQKLLKKTEILNYNFSDYEAQRRVEEMKDVRKFRRLQPIQNSPKSSSLIRDRKRKKKYRSIHTSRKT